MMAGKVGRPPKDDPRVIPVGFKVTQREYWYLQQLAFKRGRSIGEVVRSLALAGMPAPTADDREVPPPGGF